MAKYLLSILIIFSAFNLLVSQDKPCCEITNAPNTMALFGSQEGFRNAHTEPVYFKLNDEKGKMITFPTDDGKTANAYEIKSTSGSKKFLLIFHEWWGLNDYIKKEADEWHEKLGDINVLALDLYDGNVATTREDASRFVQSVDNNRAFSIIRGAESYAGGDAVFATLGWCFGGSWSNQAAIELGKKCSACVIYYGMPEKNSERIAMMKSPVLGIFAKKDGWITPEVAEEFADAFIKTGGMIKILIYDAEHAFANPSNPNFDAEATADAKEKTLKFFKENF